MFAPILLLEALAYLRFPDGVTLPGFCVLRSASMITLESNQLITSICACRGHRDLVTGLTMSGIALKPRCAIKR